jgi:hypothetical protein
MMDFFEWARGAHQTVQGYTPRQLLWEYCASCPLSLRRVLRAKIYPGHCH